MALQLQQITELFETQGALQYGSEAVSQLQHALQCAHQAEQAGSPAALVSAALLHDLGHLLVPKERDRHAGQDDLHQYAAIPFLRGLFADDVLEPIRLHVAAKRYLCQVDPCYWAGLSPASQRSLALQGGIFSADEADAFMSQPYAADAVALRRWDDNAKNALATPPGWAHFLPVLASARSLAQV